MSSSRIITLLCALVSVLCTLMAVAHLAEHLGLVGGPHARTTGVVVDAGLERTMDDERRYRAVVEYEVDGETYRVTASEPASWRPRTGSERTVLYDVETPGDASILEVREIVVTPGLLLVTASASAVIPVLHLRARILGRLRRSAEPPDAAPSP